jgi:UDP-N-acetylglucosamine acyltransferase
VRIHPLAVVSPTARIAEDVQIGPFCVVEPNVTIGAGCRLEAGVIVKNGTILGENNRIFESAVLGGLPQHVSAPRRPGGLIVGHGNTMRENVTMHRSLEENHATIVGDNNMLMVNVHVAHDCVVGNRVIIANNSMLAGHVVVSDRAYISGGVGIHQFCRVGTLAMVGGQAHVVKDIPPYVTLDGLSSYVVGLNQIGLRRADYSRKEISRLKAAYRVIYRSSLTWSEILSRIETEFPAPPAAEFHRFLSATTRGICPERRLPPGATIKLRPDQDSDQELRAKAG